MVCSTQRTGSEVLPPRGPDRQGNSELAGTIADAQDEGHGGAGLAGGRDAQVYLNYPLDNAGRSACVSDLGELAAELRLHQEDGPREAAGGNSISFGRIGMTISANGGQEGSGILWESTGDYFAGTPGTLHA
jgi:hypothetical protein